LIRIEKLFNASPPLEPHLVLVSTKTPTNLFSQLHKWLKGKVIPIGDISKLNTPSDYFSDGTITHCLREVAKDRHPPDTSFSVQGGFFPPPIKRQNVMAPSIVSSLKSLYIRTTYFVRKNLLRWWATFQKFFDWS